MLSFLQPLDPILKGLGMTRANFFTMIVVFVLIFLLSAFEKQIYRWKENTKAYLRKQIQGFTVQRHLTENGKTVETSELPSVMSHIVSMLDYVFLAPDKKDTEGFKMDSDDEDDDNDDDDDDEDDDDDDDDEDYNDDNEDGSQEGFDDNDDNDEYDDETDIEMIKNIL